MSENYKEISIKYAKENADLKIALNQAMGALGYPVPDGTPESDLKCGMCACKEKDYQDKQIENKTLWSVFRLIMEYR